MPHRPCLIETRGAVCMLCTKQTISNLRRWPPRRDVELPSYVGLLCALVRWLRIRLHWRHGELAKDTDGGGFALGRATTSAAGKYLRSYDGARTEGVHGDTFRTATGPARVHSARRQACQLGREIAKPARRSISTKDASSSAESSSRAGRRSAPTMSSTSSPTSARVRISSRTVGTRAAYPERSDPPRWR